MIIECHLNELKELEALDSGVYSVLIEQEPKLIKNPKNDNEGLQFVLSVTDSGHEGRKIFYTLWKGKAGWGHFKTKEVCKAAKVKWTEDGFDTSDFVQSQMRVVVSKEEKGGRLVNDVDRFLAA